MQKKTPKRPQKKQDFQTNSTIKQKRARYVKSNLIFTGISSLLVYFMANTYLTFSSRFRAFSWERLVEWIATFPLSETIFSPPKGIALLLASLLLIVETILAVKGYSRITDDITTEHGTAQWGSIKDFNSRYSLSVPQSTLAGFFAKLFRRRG